MDLKFYIIFFVVISTTAMACAQQLAFPGAEGYGRLTTGGRGGKVIEVTNLNDSGTGSLRAAVQTMGARTVVFRVSGTIELKSELVITNGNLTIAGQTAPGDGICIRNYPVIIDADNVIIRYLRVRLGDETKLAEDAISCIFHKNIIIDHCSFSWGIDEVATFRDNENATVQWCLVSESLYNSYHHKGPHGYGGIWGGKGATFHHNLLAHHSSRNPRFNGSRYHGEPEKEIVDYRNNVIYNWGMNSAYGGEAGKQNLVANYYKYGPATKRKDRIVEPWNDQGQWYITGNFVYGFPKITADNWAGGVQGDFWKRVRVDSPHPFSPVLTYPAEKAYELVLADVGAVLPRRDAAHYGGIWGAGSGIIDSQKDVGGWPRLNSAPAPTDADHDGMADDWEVAHGLDPTDPEDRNDDFNGDGYTNLEKYLTSLTIREDFILPPAGLTATAVSSSQIDLVWQENALAETGFSIERSEKDTLSFSEVARVGANDTSYSDTGLSSQTRYYYRIRTYNAHVYSIYTNYASATTLTAESAPAEK
ncbi:MAG: fibronectin type III domain-containing protein [candidate division KSB1 bacterium]|nr:fibronectin type III domain-containing protein [candidate division KSB1 bacterium]